jgi:hypothetical protein
VAANKEELLAMIAHGAEKIISSTDEYIFFSLLLAAFMVMNAENT